MPAFNDPANAQGRVSRRRRIADGRGNAHAETCAADRTTWRSARVMERGIEADAVRCKRDDRMGPGLLWRNESRNAMPDINAALPLAEALGRWHEFYMLLGGASATMVGLLFVAATVAPAFSPGWAALRYGCFFQRASSISAPSWSCA